MFRPFKRVRCQCTVCGHHWRIPLKRILRFERMFNIKEGQPFIWECHDCHEGVVIPCSYKNIHGNLMNIDPKKLDPDTEVFSF